MSWPCGLIAVVLSAGRVQVVETLKKENTNLFPKYVLSNDMEQTAPQVCFLVVLSIHSVVPLCAVICDPKCV